MESFLVILTAQPSEREDSETDGICGHKSSTILYRYSNQLLVGGELKKGGEKMDHFTFDYSSSCFCACFVVIIIKGTEKDVSRGCEQHDN